MNKRQDVQRRFEAGEFIWPDDIDVFEADLMAILMDECIAWRRATVRPWHTRGRLMLCCHN